MVNENSYSARLVCSDKVKSYINNECKKKFLKKYPEAEGSKITENQILTDLIKSDLGLFYLEDGKPDTD